MKSSYLWIIALCALLLATAAYIEVSRFRMPKAGVGAPLNAHLEDDKKLLAQLAHPSMSSTEINLLPVYSDFERTVRSRVAEVAQASEDGKQSLSSQTDYIERYPVDGVPGQFLAEYLRQNEKWGQIQLVMLNGRIRAIKNLEADLRAFYLSNPEEANRMSAQTDETIKSALAALKPGPALVTELKEKRARLANAPDSVRRAEYANAQSAFEAWQRSL